MASVSNSVVSGDTGTSGYIGRIPIRNIWLLMLYASDLYRSHGAARFSLEESPDDLPDLVAEILAHAVESRIRRHLSLNYQDRTDVINRVRGRIDVLRTERHQLLARGLVACRFDELTVDTMRNRYVRSALEVITRIVKRGDIAHRCRTLAGTLKSMGVSGTTPTRAEMSTDRFSRHDVDDRFMVSAAQLAFDLALPSEVAGANVLPLPGRDERWARQLFERAIGGFYEVTLSREGWRVKCGTRLRWQVDCKTPGIDKFLPSMKSDIVLDHSEPERRIVIDTKFNSILTAGHYRDETVRSGYLYQIYAYLKSQVGNGDSLADKASGLLLHPSIGQTVDESVVIQGQRIRFATVDLAATAQEIRAQLLRMRE